MQESDLKKQTENSLPKKTSKLEKVIKLISHIMAILTYCAIFAIELLTSAPEVSFSIEFLVVFTALFLTTFDWSIFKFSDEKDSDKQTNSQDKNEPETKQKIPEILAEFIKSNTKIILIGISALTIFIPGMPILAVLIAISAIFIIAQIIDILKSEEATAENGVTISKTKTRIAKVFTLANTIIAGLLVFASIDSISELIGVENIFGAEAASIDAIAGLAICLIFAIIMNSIASGFKDSLLNLAGSIEDRNKGLSKTKKVAIGLAVFAGIGLLVLPTIALFTFLTVDLSLAAGLAGFITAIAVLVVGLSCGLVLARESRKSLEAISNAILFFKEQSPLKKAGLVLMIGLMATAAYFITAAADFTGFLLLDIGIALAIFTLAVFTLILPKIPEMKDNNKQKHDPTNQNKSQSPLPAQELKQTSTTRPAIETIDETKSNKNENNVSPDLKF